MKHTVSKIIDDDGHIFEGEYVYRGHEFRRDDDVPTGYYGRYTIGSFRNGRGFATRKRMLTHIDKLVTAEGTT